MADKKVVISADSTCDLNEELKKQYNVQYYPFYINLRDKDYKDGVDITLEEMFNAYYEDKSLPKTAASSIGEFTEHFKQFTDKGCEVVHISLGHALSSAFANASMAAEQIDGVYVVDSCNLSNGSGQLVIRAARMAEEGKSAKEIVDELEKIKPHVHTSFVLDTLDFMAAGGRCPAIAAKAAGMLKCKPYLSVDNSDGSLHIGKMYRGKQEMVLRKYIEDELGKYDNLVLDDIFLCNSTGFEDSYIDELEQLILKTAPFKRVHKTIANGTISSHCGPRCLGILFVTD